MNEFIFTPDGLEKYLDLTQVPPTESRRRRPFMASLGIPVLAISLPGHYSRRPWPPIQNEDGVHHREIPEMKN